MIICKEFLCSIPIAMTGMRKTDSGLEMTGFPRKIWRDRSGATAIEYAFIAAGIALAIVSVVGEVGTEVNNIFVTVKGMF